MFLQINLAAGTHTEPAVWKDESSGDAYEYTSSVSNIRLLKRRAYPGTYAYADGPVLTFGYGERDIDLPTGKIPFTQEFLYCRIDLASGQMVLQRDAYCTLRLFYTQSASGFYCSDDMAEVVRNATSHDIDEQALADELFLLGWSDRTLFKDVSLAGNAAQLKWEQGIFSSLRTVPEIDTMTGDATAFKHNLEATFQNYWQACSGDRIGFEVSGGIDSSTMPLYISRKHTGEPPVMGAMQFQDGFGRTQVQKLLDLAANTDGELFTSQLDSALHFPLARFFLPDYSPRPFYHYQEIYTEALSALARDFAGRGIEVVYTGIGGDELFENNTAAVSRRRVERSQKILDKSLFFTDGARELFNTHRQAARPGYAGLLAESAYIAGQSRNSIYIDHGIWPVAPLADPKLLGYCQGLPVAFRSNKNILRGYHEASGMPASIYQPSQNEHFGMFFRKSLSQNYTGVIGKLMQRSVLHERDIIDTGAVLTTFRHAQDTDDIDKHFFDIYRLCGIEINLQALDDPS